MPQDPGAAALDTLNTQESDFYNSASAGLGDAEAKLSKQVDTSKWGNLSSALGTPETAPQPQSQSSSGPVSPVTLGDKSFDFSHYAADSGYGSSIQSTVNELRGTAPENVQAYITQKSPHSLVRSDDIHAAAQQYGIPWQPLLAVMQKESSIGTSHVAAANNNPGGITWSPTYQASHPNVTKGTPRPPNEGGNYVRFPTMQDGIGAVAEQVKRRMSTSTAQASSAPAPQPPPAQVPNNAVKDANGALWRYSTLEKTWIKIGDAPVVAPQQQADATGELALRIANAHSIFSSASL